MRCLGSLWLLACVGMKVQGIRSANGWAIIVAIGISFADPTVASMHQDFASLMNGDLASCLNSLCLCFVDACEARVAYPSDSPVTFDGNNMLILSHIFLEFESCSWLSCASEIISQLLQMD